MQRLLPKHSSSESLFNGIQGFPALQWAGIDLAAALGMGLLMEAGIGLWFKLSQRDRMTVFDGEENYSLSWMLQKDAPVSICCE